MPDDTGTPHELDPPEDWLTEIEREQEKFKAEVENPTISPSLRRDRPTSREDAAERKLAQADREAEFFGSMPPEAGRDGRDGPGAGRRN